VYCDLDMLRLCSCHDLVRAGFAEWNY